MITLKELGKYYNVEKHKDMYLLFDLEKHGKRSVKLYCGYIKKIKNGVFKVDGFEPTRKLDVLLQNIKEYAEKTFKYDQEHYCPTFRKGYFEELVTIDFLYEHGFKSEHVNIHRLLKELPFGKSLDILISFDGLDTMDSKYFNNDLPEHVTIFFEIGEYTARSIKVKRNADDIIDALSSSLKMAYTMLAVDSLNQMSKFGGVSGFEILELNYKDFNIEKKDYKQTLINELEKMLETLKQK